MTDNVIHLPRPRAARSPADTLGFFIRVGRNDHKELLHVLAAGERSIFGFVIEAQYAKRHRDLITEARKRDLDVILDPKTQPLALPGGFNDLLGALPWGGVKHHTLADFDGDAGRRRAAEIVSFAVRHNCTQIFGPSHVLAGPNDPWLRRDIQMMGCTADAIQTHRADLGLIYSLALPMDILRKQSERQAIVHALEDAPKEALWLKIENFGDDASGEKTAAYIREVRDFHSLGVPIVADHVGGLPATAALAFGAVGGIAHGVTFNQSFSASRWRRPPTDKKGSGAPTRRVYLPSLDMLVKPAEAEAFFAVSSRVRGRHTCRDTHCCPHGQKDMLEKAARHAIYQRARELDWLGGTPQDLRPSRYVDERVRPVSDDVATAAGLPGLSEPMQKALKKKQASISRFRQVMGHLVTETQPASIAMAPRRRSAR